MKTKPRRRLSRRGISAVISEIILCAVVLAVGGAVWNYAAGASSIIAGSYVKGVTDLMDVTIERFAVEHVTYVDSSHVLRVWVYNYGSISVVVDVYASTGGSSWSKLGSSVSARSLVAIDIPLSVAHGSELAIKAVSWRGNNALSRYLMP